MSMMQLVDEWEEPLTEDDRRLLFEELESRGYRTKSLPEPPAAEEQPPPLVRAAKPGEDDSIKKRIRGGVGACLFVAGASVVAALVTGGKGPAGIDVPPAILYGMAILYVLFAFGIHKRSRVVAALAFAVFCIDRILVMVEAGRPVGIGITVLVGILLLMALRATLEHHHRAWERDPDYRSLSKRATVAWAAVGAVALLIFGGLAIVGAQLPTPTVVEAAELRSDHLRYLRSSGVVERGESVLLFYSYGLTSIEEGGCALTDRGVVAYGVRPEDGETWIQPIPYDEILSAEIVEKGSAFTDSMLRVEGEGAWVEVPFPTEGDGDVRALEMIQDRMD